MFLCHRYQILERLGRGAFGQTYLAEDIHLPGNPRCVIKQLKPIANEPHIWQEYRRRFDLEAAILYELGCHDQIPQLFDRFEYNREFYLVFELIQGHPLSRELVAGCQWSEFNTISLLENILTPLAFVHQHNVIHGQIQPSHLIRRKRDDQISLINVGSIQLIFDQGETRKPTIGAGSSEYLPQDLEKWQTQSKFSSDIYAVGMIGIQALTGWDSQQLLQFAQTVKDPDWWQGMSLSPELINVLNRMVYPQQSEPYLSAMEALADVQQCPRSSILPTSQPAPQPRLLPRISRLNFTFEAPQIKLRWGLGIAIALFFGFGGFFWVWFHLNPDSTETSLAENFSSSVRGKIQGYEILNNGVTVELKVIGNDAQSYRFSMARKIIDRIPNASPLPSLKNRTIQITELKPDRKLGTTIFAIDRAEQVLILD